MKFEIGDVVRNDQNGVEGIILDFRGPFPLLDIPRQAIVHVTYTPFTRSLRLHKNLFFNLRTLQVIKEGCGGT